MRTLEQKIAELETEQRIREMLPPDIGRYTISNVDKDGNAWISFSPPSYDPEGEFDAQVVGKALEDSGFVLQPASLVRWDQWRASPYPSEVDDVPDEKDRYKKTWAKQISPVWVRPSQYCNAEAQCFMKKDGLLFNIHIGLPRSGWGVSAHRNEYMGGWNFARGTARLSTCSKARSIPGHSMSNESFAAVVTNQGLDASVYWTPDGSNPLSLSEFLSYIKG